MTDLAAGLSAQQAATRVPALPAWTVRETYAHLAGVCREVREGVLTARATDEDTARQVAARADRELPELCAEWDEIGPGIEEALAGPKGYRYHLMMQDVWNHEQDVLGALGMPQVRGDETTVAVSTVIADMYARGWEKFEVSPALRLRTPSLDRVIGVGEPVATLDTTDFELARMLIGRRTRDEIRDAGWSGAQLSSEVLERLHFFPCPEKSLGE